MAKKKLAKKKSVDELIDELTFLLEDVNTDVRKFVDKGNNAAGARIRKEMQEVKKKAQEIRILVQEIKNS